MHKLDEYLEEAKIINITKQLRGDVDDERIEDNIGGMINALGITLNDYRKDNNRKVLKNRVGQVVDFLTTLYKDLK